MNLILGLMLALSSPPPPVVVNQSGQCPQITVNVTGLNGVNTTFTYEAIVQNKGTRKLKYLWTVESARIISGQGKARIKAKITEKYKSYAGTVEVQGLPAGCSNVAAGAPAVI